MKDIGIQASVNQHSSPEAYRRDRRKDLLMQKNSCFVLRFLCEDVGSRLDHVLDGILRGLAHRSRAARGGSGAERV